MERGVTIFSGSKSEHGAKNYGGAFKLRTGKMGTGVEIKSNKRKAEEDIIHSLVIEGVEIFAIDTPLNADSATTLASISFGDGGLLDVDHIALAKALSDMSKTLLKAPFKPKK